MPADRLHIMPSRSGLPTVQADGVVYHSVYSPLREAEQFYEGLRLEEADILLHFGWGLGYGAEILRNRAKPEAEIVVFEPDEELFKLARLHSPNRDVYDDPRFRFVVGPSVCHFFDDWGLAGCQETDQILWISWPAAAQQHASLVDSVRRQLKKYLRDRAANLLTHFQNGEMYFRNAIANFKYQDSADAGRLFRRFRNVPMVIVSAGPSLDRNIHELAGFEDRCFILSVDTALRPLLAAGITPHAVVLADPSELNSRHVVGAMPQGSYLIAEQAAHPNALASARQQFLFGLGLFPDSLFTKFGFGKSRLGAWGSVSTTALDLACRMGASPIIFAGQDFAYTGGRNYARHTIFHDVPFNIELANTVQTTDIQGNTTHSTENLVAYRDYFVRRLKQAPGVRFINATEGGILAEGVEILPLQTALEEACGDRVPVRATLQSCYRPSEVSDQALRHLLNVLTTRPSSCDCLDGFLELTAKKHLLTRNDAEIENAITRGAQTLNDILERRES
jgi:hypothetical protein